MALCGKCGSLAADGSAFCGICGAPLPSSRRTCPKCHNPMSENMQFCDQCGERYREPDPPPVPPAPPQPKPLERTSNTAVVVGSKSTGSGLLAALSTICILFCWPAAIYGFYCLNKANKASAKAEADAYIQKGKNGCFIGLGIVAIIVIIGLTL